MHRSFSLTKRHYAGNWQLRDVEDRHDRTEVNKLAFEFATTDDSMRREDLQLQLLECFHGYLLKYLNMIIFGQLPLLSAPAGKDARAFLKLLLAKRPDSLENLRDTCKTLHLAFKDQTTTDDVYDTLVFLFLRVCAHYDPLYPKKTEKVCKFIESQPSNTLIRAVELAPAVGFDPAGCIRILVRGAFLAPVAGPRKTTLGYQKGEKWPVPAKFFQTTSMGFVGFAQKFFRWYLRNYILERMKSLESTDGVLQLDHMSIGPSLTDSTSFMTTEDAGVPHATGQWTDARGVRWMADVDLMEHWRTFDISEMNDKWVEGTDDFLFRKLTPGERYILQMVFVKDASWAGIGEILQCDPETAQKRFNEIMTYLTARAKVRSMVSTGPISA